VQCGHRVALIGIVIAQAGQSFDTGAAFGAGRFIWLTAFTTRKMQNATITKLITKVIKLP
jgi:preprotein translocase subunit SecG